MGIAAERPLYVLQLDAQKNEVVVGYVEETLQSTVTADDIVWSSKASLEGEVEVQAKIRSTGYPTEARAHMNGDGTITAVFSDSVKAATVGQSLVLYEGGERILAGGGIIKEAF